MISCKVDAFIMRWSRGFSRFSLISIFKKLRFENLRTFVGADKEREIISTLFLIFAWYKQNYFFPCFQDWYKTDRWFELSSIFCIELEKHCFCGKLVDRENLTLKLERPGYFKPTAEQGWLMRYRITPPMINLLWWVCSLPF